MAAKRQEQARKPRKLRSSIELEAFHQSDIIFVMSENQMEVHQKKAEPWRVTLVDTGKETLTGGRLIRVAGYLQDESDFCFTYGDGLADIDISSQLAFHRKHGKLATVTAVQPPGRYGALLREGSEVRGFQEIPKNTFRI